MRLNLPTLFLATVLTNVSSALADDDGSGWRKCYGDDTCLTRCESQHERMGDCKAKCDFTNPTQGRQCTRICVEHHVMQAPNIIGGPIVTEEESITSQTPMQLHHNTDDQSHGHANCWRSCNGDSQCLDRCDEQIRGIGECKARCDFTVPAQGIACVKKCRDDHIFQTPTGNVPSSVAGATPTANPTFIGSSTGSTVSKTFVESGTMSTERATPVGGNTTPAENSTPSESNPKPTNDESVVNFPNSAIACAAIAPILILHAVVAFINI